MIIEPISRVCALSGEVRSSYYSVGRLTLAVSGMWDSNSSYVPLSKLRLSILLPTRELLFADLPSMTCDEAARKKVSILLAYAFSKLC